MAARGAILVLGNVSTRISSKDVDRKWMTRLACGGEQDSSLSKDKRVTPGNRGSHATGEDPCQKV